MIAFLPDAFPITFSLVALAGFVFWVYVISVCAQSAFGPDEPVRARVEDTYQPRHMASRRANIWQRTAPWAT